MICEERIIWIWWISIIFVLFGVGWALWHFGCMILYAGGINYLRQHYPVDTN